MIPVPRCDDAGVSESAAIDPDTKDWTWVIDRACPDCGFDGPAVTVDRLGTEIRDNATGFEAALADVVAARVRPAPAVWSVLEYAAHVRDVHLLFAERVRLMLDRDEPRFANWDQDVTAVESRYDRQDPAVVARELLDAAAAVADLYESVPPGAWSRRGYRSNGSEFTVETLGIYHLHDVVHHLWDVEQGATAVTIASYDAHATAYAAGAPAVTDELRALLDRFAALVGPGGRVLEVGSGPGRDAAALEERGLRVRRSDISQGFVDVLRAAGHDAVRLDPLVDDLADPTAPEAAYDGVWASATLLHVPRRDLPAVLGRLAAVTRSGGVLHVSVKEGDGEGWSTHGHVAAPRRFVYWREQPLLAAVEDAGWRVGESGRSVGRTGETWLDVIARKA